LPAVNSMSSAMFTLKLNRATTNATMLDSQSVITSAGIVMMTEFQK
jgi:hypothetical protein